MCKLEVEEHHPRAPAVEILLHAARVERVGRPRHAIRRTNRRARDPSFGAQGEIGVRLRSGITRLAQPRAPRRRESDQGHRRRATFQKRTAGERRAGVDGPRVTHGALRNTGQSRVIGNVRRLRVGRPDGPEGEPREEDTVPSPAERWGVAWLDTHRHIVTGMAPHRGARRFPFPVRDVFRPRFRS